MVHRRVTVQSTVQLPVQRRPRFPANKTPPERSGLRPQPASEKLARRLAAPGRARPGGPGRGQEGSAAGDGRPAGTDATWRPDSAVRIRAVRMRAVRIRGVLVRAARTCTVSMNARGADARGAAPDAVCVPQAASATFEGESPRPPPCLKLQAAAPTPRRSCRQPPGGAAMRTS